MGSAGEGLPVVSGTGCQDLSPKLFVGLVLDSSAVSRRPAVCSLAGSWLAGCAEADSMPLVLRSFP